LKNASIGRFKRDGYCAETSFRLLVNRTSPFESAGVAAYSAAGSIAGLAMTCLSFTIDGLPTPLACFPLAQASLRIDRSSRSERALLLLSSSSIVLTLYMTSRSLRKKNFHLFAHPTTS
jgi:hypothetical protein